MTELVKKAREYAMAQAITSQPRYQIECAYKDGYSDSTTQFVNALLTEQLENFDLSKENKQLKQKLILMRKYIFGNYDLEEKIAQLKYIDEFGVEIEE